MAEFMNCFVCLMKIKDQGLFLDCFYETVRDLLFPLKIILSWWRCT